MITRDPEVAALIDEVISMAPPPPALPKVEANTRWSRRPAVLIASAVAVAGVVAALLIVSPWSNESHPSVVAPAQSDTAPPTTTLPLLPVDQAMQVPTDQRVNVADRTGGTPGWIIHDELWNQDLTQPVLVRVYNDAGQPVGYYGTFSGFVESDVAQASDFDQLQYAIEQSANGSPVPDAVKHMNLQDYNACMTALTVSGLGRSPAPSASPNQTPVTFSPTCTQLLKLQGWPVGDAH
jgi:hypothetical protein